MAASAEQGGVSEGTTCCRRGAQRCCGDAAHWGKMYTKSRIDKLLAFIKFPKKVILIAYNVI